MKKPGFSSKSSVVVYPASCIYANFIAEDGSSDRGLAKDISSEKIRFSTDFHRFKKNIYLFQFQTDIFHTTWTKL